MVVEAVDFASLLVGSRAGFDCKMQQQRW
jgi:hypothetical protein